VLLFNANVKKIIGANAKLVEKQSLLLERNRMQDEELEKRISELEGQNVIIETLQQQQEELAEQLHESDQRFQALLKEKADEVTLLREQTREHREQIKLTADMTDEELLAWVDLQIEETRLFTDPSLTLKKMAKALGLTQKRLGQLFKNQEKFNNLGKYLTEKRFLLACELMRENPEWTIEAVAKEAGFLTRRTFQDVVKAHLGLTPSQFRQTLNQ
jgi:AraC-like DNA-binding protein